MKRLMLKTLAAAGAISAFGVAFAQEKTIKFTTQNPKGHPLVMGMEKFAEIVQAKSGGKIKVNLFPGGVLGGDAPVVSALQGGTIEMASMPCSKASVGACQPASRCRWTWPTRPATSVP